MGNPTLLRDLSRREVGWVLAPTFLVDARWVPAPTLLNGVARWDYEEILRSQ